MKKSMSSFMDASLTRAEMKSLIGGWWTMSCQCANGTTWTGSGMDCSDFLFFTNYYCGQKGGSHCNGTGKVCA